MSIIKVGELFPYKFGDKEELRFEVLLGGLPGTFFSLKPFRNIKEDDKYQIALQLTKEEYDEIEAEFLPKLMELNEQGGYGAKKKELQDLFSRVVGESTREEGTYRFYGSRKMGYLDRETQEMKPFSLNCYDGGMSEDKLIEGGVRLGAGSIVRSKFVVSLFRGKGGVFMNLNPVSVVVLKHVEPPKRESLNYEGVDDSSAYDY